MNTSVKQEPGSVEDKCKYNYIYYIDYIPKTLEQENPRADEDRDILYSLMRGQWAVTIIQNIVADIKAMTREDPSSWFVCFIPASNEERTKKRYRLIADVIDKRLGISVSLDTLTLKDRVPRHYKDNEDSSKNQYTVIASDIFQKNVILIDDLINTGETLNYVGDFLMSSGALSVHGLMMGKTVHPEPKDKI